MSSSRALKAKPTSVEGRQVLDQEWGVTEVVDFLIVFVELLRFFQALDDLPVLVG
jgi:hypothetical protein